MMQRNGEIVIGNGRNQQPRRRDWLAGDVVVFIPMARQDKYCCVGVRISLTFDRIVCQGF